tara:strand:+ start:354 stop:1091 length:738 start_codon:yes stop_codon:yes gene_type:complete
MKAIIPVGGLGTRMHPLSKAIPKELLPMGNMPLIDHIVAEAMAAGVTEIILISSKGKGCIEDNFINSGIKIASVRQYEPLGLGHAILCAKHLIDDTFAILLPDELMVGNELCLQQMVKITTETKPNIVALCKVKPNVAHNYGIASIDRCNKINTIIEKPLGIKQDSMAVIGRYILTPTIFEILNTQKVGYNSELQLTDAINSMTKYYEPVHGLHYKGKRFDCGNLDGYAEANNYLYKEKLNAKNI